MIEILAMLVVAAILFLVFAAPIILVVKILGALAGGRDSGAALEITIEEK